MNRAESRIAECGIAKGQVFRLGAGLQKTPEAVGEFNRFDGVIPFRQRDIGIIDMLYIGNDSTAAEIASTFPAADSANVDVFAPIVIVFTEQLAPSSIPDQAIAVSGKDSLVPGQVGYDSGSQTIRFVPANAFNTETTYTVTLQTQGDDNQ